MPRLVRGFALLFAPVIFTVTMCAALPPPAPPVTVDPSFPNLFYGAVPAANPNGPVVVFIHGISGTYQDWLEGKNCSLPCTGTANDMYDLAYQAGLRTVFLSLSADNSANNDTIQQNSAELQMLFPAILSHYNVTKVYFVCKDKGGLDLQNAIANPLWIGISHAVMMIGTPNQGAALADWFYSPAGQSEGQKFGLLTPAMQSMEIANVLFLRSTWDVVFQNAGIPFFTLSGNTSLCSHTGGCFTNVTGPILTSITGGAGAPANDGLVDEPETLLPATYGMELGVVATNYEGLRLGVNTFNFIYGQVTADDNRQNGVAQVATGGFGDLHNTWAWSMAWFKNKLYVGTGREVNCVTAAEAFVTLGLPGLYPPSIGDCTPDFHHLPLQAEIWQYDPSTGIWARVFQSPNSLTTTDNQGKTVATGRDIGFRDMAVVTEPRGVTALYALGVTSGQIFTDSTNFQTWAPPRILRSTDGITWRPIPQNTSVGGVCPATSCFLGDLTQNGVPGYGNVSLRSGTQLNPGQPNSILFLQVGDFIGVGRVISSVPGVNPALGDNCGLPACFQWASPSTADLPVWVLEGFNNFVYAGTGNPPAFTSLTYGVFKTDGTGAAPYTWTPIITNGAYATGLIADYAMSMRIFADSQYCPGIGCLYVGTDAANEMIRIRPDNTGAVQVDSVDSWDLVIGNPRTIPQGQPGAGGTISPISGIGQYFDNGFTGHFWNMGVGSQGLYMGTWDWSADHFAEPPFSELWSQEFGTDIWRTPDGVHWSFVSKVGLGDGANTGGRSFAGTPHGLFMGTARSIGGTQVFQLDNGASPAPAKLAAPVLHSAPGSLAMGASVSLDWQPISGAQQYLVYRIALSSSQTTPPPGIENTLAEACSNVKAGVAVLCSELPAVRASTSSPLYGYPGPPALIATVTSTTYSENAPTSLQSLYFVRAEDARGSRSEPSNVVGGPSLAAQ